MAKKLNPVRVTEKIVLFPPLPGKTEPRPVRLVTATFPPERLEVMDSRHPRFQSLFRNPEGATAEELAGQAEMQGIRIIAGGVYFDETGTPEEKGPRVPVGFVLFHPAGGKRRIVSEPAPFVSGGYLVFHPEGNAALIRWNEMTAMSSLKQARLVVQSNLILAADGTEDKNKDTSAAPRAALAFNRDRSASIFVMQEPVGVKEFGDLLVAQGVLHAINLDGGPSVQLAERLSNGEVKNWVPWEKKNKPSRMPLLFMVRESR